MLISYDISIISHDICLSLSDSSLSVIISRSVHVAAHGILIPFYGWVILQCSCLEKLRDGGAWWAAVYGVAQSRTRLKRLSSSSSSTPWCTWTTPSLPSSSWTFRFCFHVLAIVKRAAVDTGLHVAFPTTIFSGCTPRNGIAESYGSPVLSFYSFLYCRRSSWVQAWIPSPAG